MLKGRHKMKISDDLGFGVSPTQNNQRMMNKDGSSNLLRKGLPLWKPHEAYNSLIYMSWTKFWIIILLGYIIINTLFASIYVFIGIEHLRGGEGTTPFLHFFDAFFFSAQTISTVGYGHISPSGMAASSIAAIESLLGLLAFAMATGLLYGRFSRPTSKILYSDNLLISPYKEGKALMLRLANFRSNQLIDVEVQLYLSYNVLENDKEVRKFLLLNLERDNVAILVTSWTIVHPINEDSPIMNFNKDALENSGAEFLVLLKSFDDTFAQTVHSRTSYTASEIVENARFIKASSPSPSGILEFDLSKIGIYELI